MTSVEAEWEALLRRIEAGQGQLDILVNNAGIVGTYDTITTASMSDYHRVIAVNQPGFFLGMRFAIPLMQRGGKGSIVNVSSIWGLTLRRCSVVRFRPRGSVAPAQHERS